MDRIDFNNFKENRKYYILRNTTILISQLFYFFKRISYKITNNFYFYIYFLLSQINHNKIISIINKIKYPFSSP